MAIKERVFHLGKKPYDFQLENNKSILLIGRSVYDTERQECKLDFYYTIIEKGTPIDLPSLLGGAKKLGEYKARSDKFKFGTFEDFDAQRYLKSRYRDLIRLANRQPNKNDIVGIFDEVCNGLLS